MEISSKKARDLWVQFDALQMGSGWDEQDIGKRQILVEDVWGDSHPGSVHLNQLTEQICRGIYEQGGCPARSSRTECFRLPVPGSHSGPAGTAESHPGQGRTDPVNGKTQSAIRHRARVSD